ncbi:MAG TPA: tetratricopeptide repeat protein [Chitinophagaceae bacterium]|nr:tetratricopeptide repeat protein [Chitinophagaceae bacterium]
MAAYRILGITCLLLFSVNISAQTNYLDSLKRELSKNVEDTFRVFTLCRVSAAYMDNNTDSSMTYAVMANDLAVKLNFKKGEWQSLNLIANISSEITDYADALKMHVKILKMHEEVNDSLRIAVTLNNIAEVYRREPDYNEALRYYFLAMNVFKKQNADTFLATTLLNIGETYKEMAIQNLPEKNQYLDSARRFAYDAYNLAEDLKNTELIGATLVSRADIHQERGEADEALSLYDLGIAKAKMADDNQTLSNAYYGIASLQKKLNKSEQAIRNALQAMQYLSGYKNKKMAQDVSKLLWQLYIDVHNKDSALKYSTMYSTLSDEIRNDEKNQELQRTKFEEQGRERDMAQAKLEIRIKRKNNLQMLGIAIFIVSFFAFLTQFSKRKVSRNIVRFLGLLGLLLVFEFVSQFIDPYIAQLTNHVPYLFLAASVVIALILYPFHTRMEHWIKHRLVKRRRRVARQGHKVTHAPSKRKTSAKVDSKKSVESKPADESV